jgi:hypothetical protein
MNLVLPPHPTLSFHPIGEAILAKRSFSACQAVALDTSPSGASLSLEAMWGAAMDIGGWLRGLGLEQRANEDCAGGG